jgi:hypothetical protein
VRRIARTTHDDEAARASAREGSGAERSIDTMWELNAADASTDGTE